MEDISLYDAENDLEISQKENAMNVKLELTQQELLKLKELVDAGMREIKRSLSQFDITGALDEYRTVKEKIDAVPQIEERRIYPTSDSSDGMIWVLSPNSFASNFQYVTKELDNGNKMGIVVDLNTPNSRSVTNDVYNIAEHLGVEHLVYRDSCGEWTYWGREKGFATLYVKIEGKGEPVPPTSMDMAIEIAIARYVNK